MKSIDLTKTIPLNLFLFSDQALENLSVDLSFTLITEAESDSVEHLKQARQDQNSSFSKVVTFVESVLNETFVYNISDGDLVNDNFYCLQNNFMVLPDVSEMTILAALHYKFNSIISDNSLVTTITLNEKMQNLTFNYTFIDDGEGYSELPSHSEWCPPLSYWDSPWWCRKDIMTLDRVAKDQEEYDKWCSSEKSKVDQSSVDLFDEIDNQYQAMFSDIDIDEKEGELIEVDFKNTKPRLVD